jgi:hypothetical protein
MVRKWGKWVSHEFLHMPFRVGDSDQLCTRECESGDIWSVPEESNGFLMDPKHYDLVNYNHTLCPTGLDM